MNKTLMSNSRADTTAFYKAELEQCLTSIDRLREQIEQDQREIDRSHARTQANIDDLARLLGPSSQKAA